MYSPPAGHWPCIDSAVPAWYTGIPACLGRHDLVNGSYSFCFAFVCVCVSVCLCVYEYVFVYVYICDCVCI